MDTSSRDPLRKEIRHLKKRVGLLEELLGKMHAEFLRLILELKIELKEESERINNG